MSSSLPEPRWFFWESADVLTFPAPAPASFTDAVENVSNPRLVPVEVTESVAGLVEWACAPYWVAVADRAHLNGLWAEHVVVLRRTEVPLPTSRWTPNAEDDRWALLHLTTYAFGTPGAATSLLYWDQMRPRDRVLALQRTLRRKTLTRDSLTELLRQVSSAGGDLAVACAQTVLGVDDPEADTLWMGVFDGGFVGDRLLAPSAGGPVVAAPASLQVRMDEARLRAEARHASALIETVLRTIRTEWFAASENEMMREDTVREDAKTFLARGLSTDLDRYPRPLGISLTDTVIAWYGMRQNRTFS